MSYQLQPKPLQLFYYLPYIHQLAIPMVPQYPYCNFPQQVSPIYYPVIPGTSQDNCIVIEDDNQIQHPLNQIHSMMIPTQTNRESNFLQEDVMQQEQLVQKITHQNNNLNENQPHIRITVYKQHSSQTDQEFILQNDRILGSNYKKEIIIGRKKQQEDNQENCDIYLPHGDKNVEKVHCKILTDKGFAFSNTLTKPLLLFFSIIKNNPHASKLPFSVIKHIYSFIKNKPQFYISDNGTRNGTFMKIKKDKIRIIEQENTYLIGADTFFHVLEMKSQPKQNKSKKVKDLNFFYNALAKEHIRKGAKIHGLTIEETEMFNITLNEIKTTKQKQRTSQKLSQYDRPYLKITFDNQAIHQIQTHIFIANYNQESVYKIGRSQECDVLVNINTVSRRQAQIIYKNNEWFIHDGEGLRESANGTWQSLQSLSQRNHDKKQQQSRPQLIEDQMEIKISENIIKFDFLNFGVTKKRKLNKALIQDLLNIQ
ncbi:unnamed protein product [Paramecium primaurelia]|uniref:FHA domain-containing protein n=1 Tax=Paramecium primaurelia TaxID=5886 RepID=A0A8S1K3A6_PARPR|nr:unnamed protein product [Paramecium primaurelia]